MEHVFETVYGRGWQFPPVFSPAQGVSMVSGAEDVRQSLIILFSTLPGERIVRKDYGCDLNQFMFSNISTSLKTEIESEIYDSVLSCEPRAQVISVEINQRSEVLSKLTIQVSYRLRGSDTSQSLTAQLDVIDGQSSFV